LDAIPPITAPAINPPARAGPKPPRASAGAGATIADTASDPAVAAIRAILLMVLSLFGIEVEGQHQRSLDVVYGHRLTCNLICMNIGSHQNHELSVQDEQLGSRALEPLRRFHWLDKNVRAGMGK
jgi:hypothetical protein